MRPLVSAVPAQLSRSGLNRCRARQSRCALDDSALGGAVHGGVCPPLGAVRADGRPILAGGRDLYQGERRVDVPVSSGG